MRKNVLLIKTLLLLSTVFLGFYPAFSQKEDPSKAALKLVETNASRLRLSAEDQKNMEILNVYENKLAGTTMVYARQTFKQIGVYNSIQVMAFKKGELLSVSGSRIEKMRLKTESISERPSLSAGRAVSLAASNLKLNTAASLSSVNGKNEGKVQEFILPDISNDPVKTDLLWVVTKDNKVRLSWQVQIAPIKSPDHWLIRVDAQTGAILGRDNLTVYCSWNKPHPHAVDCFKAVHYEGASETVEEEQTFGTYDVSSARYRVSAFPYESPAQAGGAPSIQVDPWTLAPANSPATTLKWHNDGAANYNYTRGNNVYAQEDRDGLNNTIGKPATSTTSEPSLTFDFSPDFTLQPVSGSNQSLAITNLFYWNNIMHDISYLYGFDEVAGNFQATNLGRGGFGNDYVMADAQDSSGINNASFSTPPDGSRPRMQMHLFSAPLDKITKINSPASLAGYITSVENSFEARNKLADIGPVTGDIVLVNDKKNPAIHEGCDVIANASALKGKIAMIDRGNCSFTIKVKNAQLAGAIAVIIVNSEPGLIGLSGEDASIVIPAVMIMKEDGTKIKTALEQGKTVNVTLDAILLDGDLDNGIITHEYTHGISNRLTGGPSITHCLQNAEQMGEGWSDYMTLMVTTDWSKAKKTDGSKPRTIGGYVMGEPAGTGYGIRNFPYSTDMTVNPWSYEHLEITEGEPHNVGEIWATTLWDMTWDLIQTEGINASLYNTAGIGGNSVSLKLVMEGMRLQPCSPGFIDARDAILKADTILFGGKYSCTIWKSFARRGMGARAAQGSADSISDQVTDYTIPASAVIKKVADKESGIEGDEINYSITATCQCAPLNNYTITDTLSSDAVYISSNGTYKEANKTVTYSNISLNPSTSKTFTLKVRIKDSTYKKPTVHINETITGATIPDSWKATSNSNTVWSVVNTRNHTSPYSFFVPDSPGVTRAVLVTNKSYPLTGVSTLSFWHFYDTEAGFDGGVVEITTTEDSVWYDLGPYMTRNGYNSSIDPGNKISISGRKAFTGNSNNQFINTVIDLSAFAGKKVKIRFVFAADQYEGAEGWYLDDINLKSESGIHNIALMHNPADSVVSSGFANTIITGKSLPIVLGDFSALKKAGTALLQWNTLQEENTSKFVIQRSGDGVQFNVIGTVAAAGNSNLPVNYQFTDGSPLSGANFYRLQQVDKDGKYGYSETRLLNFNDLTTSVIIAPNPASDKITVTVPGNTKPLQLILLNPQGQQVTIFSMDTYSKQLNLPNLAAGVYHLKIKGDGIESSHKIVIKK